MNDPQRPLLFLFAGKAHPADEPGQQVLREIKQLMLTPEFMGRIVFLEDYDLQLARWLVSGVDIWLNNPDRAARGERHLGHEGRRERAPEPERARRLVGGGLDAGQRLGHSARHGPGPGAPRCAGSRADLRHASKRRRCLSITDATVSEFSAEWVRRSKRAMSTVIPRFNTRRMVFDYARGVYFPAARHYAQACVAGVRGRATARGMEAARAPGVAEGLAAHA